MKLLILNTDYREFLSLLYISNPGLDEKPYDEQMRVRNETLFGVADFYSKNLRKLGHEAWDIHFNNRAMQRKWAREHGIKISSDWRWQFRLRKRIFPWISRVRDLRNRRWFYDILKAQIKYYKPDVLFNQAMEEISSRFLKNLRPYFRLLVGQIASPLTKGQDFSCYDLVISSLPNFVDYFRNLGIPSELNRFAFEPRVLEKLKNNNKAIIPVSFVGSLSQSHAGRVSLFYYLCQQLDVRVWGSDIDSLPKDSPIRQCYKGEAWGIEMYQIMHKSKITLNHHIDVADKYANNMRLFEATGVGALLITDWKENLHEMFEPGKEVVAYRNWEECVELIQYYLEHEEERESIACAGQERTTRKHTYYQRMQELLDIVGHYL